MASIKIIINDYRGGTIKTGQAQTEFNLPTPLEGMDWTESAGKEIPPAPTMELISSADLEAGENLPTPDMGYESGMTKETEMLPTPEMHMIGDSESFYEQKPIPCSPEDLKIMDESGKAKSENTIPRPDKIK